VSVTLYLGAPRSGKSTLLRAHVYRSRVPLRAFLVMDRDGQGTWDGPTFRSIGELRARATLPRFCIFRGPSSEEVARLAVELGWCAYVDEEAHRALAEGYGPARKEREAHPLYRIAHEGAHLADGRGEPSQVAALLATHRPANLPADLVACAERVYLGRTVLWRDVERCYREGWVPDAQSPRDAQRILGALTPGDFLTFSLRG
jgi:hypothetical protein